MRYLLSVFVFILVSKEYVNAQKTADYHTITVEAKRRVSNSDGTVIYRPYEPFKTRSIESLTGYKIMTEPGSLSKYGGDFRHRIKATGFFRVEKIGDRWWGVDPEGYRYINVALNSINRGKSERNAKALAEKYVSPEKWITETISMLQDNGFNCAGSWSDYKAIIEANKTSDKPFAYTINWNFMSSYGRERGGTYQQPGHTGYPNDAIFVFDPEFEIFCDRHAKQLLETKDDPNLFGHFSDNEMPFKLKALDNYLRLPETDPGHKAAVKWMEEQGILRDNISDKHRELFMAFVAEKYLSIISAAIRKYDPNHMYIGARFYSSEKNYPEFMKSAGKYLDIVSNNYYGKWTPDSTDMANWAKWTRRPFIITEYYTKGEDSGMPNQSGAGWIVKTQRDRGLFYQNYNLALLQSKSCVGWHYFKYQDNDPTAKGADPSNVDANKGIVDNDYNVWKPMMELMRELNNNVYTLTEYFDK